MSTRSEIRARWRRILQEQRASGLSVADFCRQTGVQYSGFYKWRRKLAGEAMFAEVKLLPQMATSASIDAGTAWVRGEFELRLPGQRSVVVPQGFDRQTLIDLLDVLEAGAVEFARREAGR